MHQVARSAAPQPLDLLRPPTPRQRLTSEVKRLAAEHGLTITAVTSAAAFPGLEPILLRHIAAGQALPDNELPTLPKQAEDDKAHEEHEEDQ